VEHIDENLLSQAGMEANITKNIFPKGVNVSFVMPLAPKSVYVKTYERGVGITKSCGTGMIASCTVYCLKHPEMFNTKTDVYNDGGMIGCTIENHGMNEYCARMEGNATFVYDGLINYQWNKVSSPCYTRFFKDEESCYTSFLKRTQSFRLKWCR
jgi:diaminopimelate epimerase